MENIQRGNVQIREVAVLEYRVLSRGVVKMSELFLESVMGREEMVVHK